MKVKIIVAIAGVLFGFISSVSFAQQTILSSCNDAAGSGGSVCYSIGQTVFETHAVTEGTITEGVQQPYEIFFMTGIQHSAITFECLVYPNPASVQINLRVINPLRLDLSYRLCNLKGDCLSENRIVQVESVIALDNLVPATYLVTIMKKDQLIQTYKIIKN